MKHTDNWEMEFERHFYENGGNYTNDETKKQILDFANQLRVRGSSTEAAGFAAAALYFVVRELAQVENELEDLTQQDYEGNNE